MILRAEQNTNRRVCVNSDKPDKFNFQSHNCTTALPRNCKSSRLLTST